MKNKLPLFLPKLIYPTRAMMFLFVYEIPPPVNRLFSEDNAAAGGGGVDGVGGGKYIMPLVKLSFYDHFMVARGPSMLSTYRCAFLAAVLLRETRLGATRRADLFHHTHLARTL